MSYTQGEVRLRKLNSSDANILAKWASSPRVPMNLPGLSHESFRAEATWEQIAKSEGANHYFIVELAETGQPIGMTLLYKVNAKEGTCFGGTAIFEESEQHKGYGYAAKLLQHQYAFEELGLKKVYSKALPHNEGVIRGLKGLGYTAADAGQAEYSSASPMLFELSKEAWASSAKVFR